MTFLDDRPTRHPCSTGPCLDDGWPWVTTGARAEPGVVTIAP